MQVIDGDLDGWSAERKTYFIAQNTIEELLPTPFALILTPTPDTSEYTQLAVYADFRIMLDQILQGDVDKAETTYNTLHSTFLADSSGFPCVEMATRFWQEYQSNDDIHTACREAIQYAAEHPGILTVLRSDDHGTQSILYTPEDVCPFR